MIIRDGTSQTDRPLSPLEKDHINLDEMGLEDLLSMSADYSRLLSFYDLNCRREGVWHRLFTYDETVILAMIISEDLGRAESRFLTSLTYNLEDDESHYLVVSKQIYTLAEKIDLWFKRLDAMESPVGRGMSRDIEGLISKRLVTEVQSLGEFIHRYLGEGTEGSGIDFEKFESIWMIRKDKEGNAQFTRAASSPSHTREGVDAFLKSNFYSFHNSVVYLKRIAAAYFTDTLQSGNHNPAAALFIAFLKIFKRAQDKLNVFTEKHLEFYLNAVLKIQPRKSELDSTYLIFEPDGEKKEILIKKGTEFPVIGGEDKEELVYRADNDLLVNIAKIGSLYTLYLERNDLISPESELHFVSGIKSNRIPVIEEVDTLAEKDLPAWPLFGAPKSEAKQTPSEDARIGFTVASPVLLLKEGTRAVSISLKGEYFSETGEGGLNATLKRLGDEIQKSEQDLFYKVFGHIFDIHLTIDTGWYEVPGYVPAISRFDRDCEKDCLTIRFELPANVEPVVPYSPEIHGGRYDTNLPLIRFTINPGAYVYPYSLLKDVIVEEIRIDVDVKDVKDLLLYNNLGQLDPNSPFNPFGPIPSVGSYLIIGNHEMSQKRITGFDVNIEWGDLPADRGGFEEYYQSYEKAFDTAAFKASATVRRDGKWLPTEEKEQPFVRLFRSEYEDPERNSGDRLCRTIRLTGAGTEFLKPAGRITKADEYRYDLRTRDGFFKFTLSAPAYAFGHQIYPTLLTRALTINSKLKKPGPVPNPPYTPLINGISIEYRAVTVLNMEKGIAVSDARSKEKVFHNHPFGIEQIFPYGKHRKGFVLPRYDSDGNLFIGVCGLESEGVLTLFFHLREDSTRSTIADTPEIQWQYLTENRWERFERSQVIYDTTNGFLSSGVVTLHIPGDIILKNTIFPDNHLWLRVCADKDLKSFCSLCMVMTQALRVTRQRNDSSPSHLTRNLPAGSIKEARISIPGIGKIRQVVESFNGRPEESAEHVRTRVSERLKHKNRATTVWDYERLILNRFPEIFKVKCFPCMSTGRWEEPHPGHILIAVIPHLKEPSSSLNFRPMVNSLLLEEITNFVKTLASPFMSVEVRNPAYEIIQIRCTVVFRKGIRGGYFISTLDDAISNYLSPWRPEGYEARFGWRIRRLDMEPFIQEMEYVDFVSNFSMLRITEDDGKFFTLFDTVRNQPIDDRDDEIYGNDEMQLEEIKPMYPWSVAIPAKKHFIQTSEIIKYERAGKTGIDELEIGDTFIITA